MTDDQVNALVERFVVSSEKIAAALEGLSETHRQDLEKRFPEKRGPSEAIVTRVPNEEDRVREAHGTSDVPIDKWLSDLEQEEEGKQDIGVREREWLDAQKVPAGSQGDSER